MFHRFLARSAAAAACQKLRGCRGRSREQRMENGRFIAEKEVNLGFSQRATQSRDEMTSTKFDSTALDLPPLFCSKPNALGRRRRRRGGPQKECRLGPSSSSSSSSSTSRSSSYLLLDLIHPSFARSLASYRVWGLGEEEDGGREDGRRQTPHRACDWGSGLCLCPSVSVSAVATVTHSLDSSIARAPCPPLAAPSRAAMRPYPSTSSPSPAASTNGRNNLSCLR